MPEYLSPGVYIEEVNTGPRPIEGVGTAMAAFVGFAPSGPANAPTLVTNWGQYVDTFGALEAGGRRNPHLEGAFLYEAHLDTVVVGHPHERFCHLVPLSRKVRERTGPAVEDQDLLAGH